jgi:hypothetical protein
MEISTEVGRLEEFAQQFTREHRGELVRVESLGGSPSRAICFPTPARHLSLHAIEVVRRNRALSFCVVLLDESRRKRRMDFGRIELVRVTDSALRLAGSGGEAVFRFASALEVASRVPRAHTQPDPLRATRLPTGHA